MHVLHFSCFTTTHIIQRILSDLHIAKNLMSVSNFKTLYNYIKTASFWFSQRSAFLKYFPISYCRQTMIKAAIY